MTNVILDPIFGKPKGAPFDPWFYPAGWDNINYQASQDQAGNPWFGGLEQRDLPFEVDVPWTVTFDVPHIKTRGLVNDGLQVQFMSFTSPEIFEAGSYSFNFTPAAGIGTVRFYPAVDAGNTGQTIIDNAYLYKQSLVDFFAIHLFGFPAGGTYTESYDLGGGKTMHSVANREWAHAIWFTHQA